MICSMASDVVESCCALDAQNVVSGIETLQNGSDRQNAWEASAISGDEESFQQVCVLDQAWLVGNGAFKQYSRSGGEEERLRTTRTSV